MCVVVDLSGVGNTYALPDTLAGPPSLAGSAIAGGTISLIGGPRPTPTRRWSILPALPRRLDALGGSSYMTTVADVGAMIQDSETTGVGLDLEGPFASNAIGPITAPSSGNGDGAGGNGTGGRGTLGTPPAPSPASIGPAKVSGTSAQVTVAVRPQAPPPARSR